MHFSAIVAALAVLGTAASAHAQSDDWDGGFNQKAKRRSDVVLELKLAPALGWARGYPNEASKIDDPRYLTNSHTAYGYDYGFWVGGALRDWFTFALGYEGFHLQRKTLNVPGYVFTLRTEIYPAWTLGCPWHDLGVALDFGIGAMTMDRNGSPRADGGAVGVAGIEVFHETLRVGGLAIGPTLGYREIFSQSLTAHLTFAGLHAAFYTGP